MTNIQMIFPLRGSFSLRGRQWRTLALWGATLAGTACAADEKSPAAIGASVADAKGAIIAADNPGPWGVLDVRDT